MSTFKIQKINCKNRAFDEKKERKKKYIKKMTTNYTYVMLLRANYHTFQFKHTRHHKIGEGIYSSWGTFCYTHKRVVNIPMEALETTLQIVPHYHSKTKREKKKMPTMQNIVVAATFLDFRTNIFSLLFKRRDS